MNGREGMHNALDNRYTFCSWRVSSFGPSTFELAGPRVGFLPIRG